MLLSPALLDCETFIEWQCRDVLRQGVCCHLPGKEVNVDEAMRIPLNDEQFQVDTDALVIQCNSSIGGNARSMHRTLSLRYVCANLTLLACCHMQHASHADLKCNSVPAATCTA